MIGRISCAVAAMLLCISFSAFAEEPAKAETAPPASETPPAAAPAPTPAPAAAPPAAATPEESNPIDSLEELEKLEQKNDLSQAQVAEKEQLKFFELNGYFRFRADLFHRLSLGVYDKLRLLGDSGTLQTDYDKKDKRKDNTVGTANMRLRLEPTLNVSEDIKVCMQLDLLDNIVLGSTPDTYRRGQGALSPGIAAFSSSQVVPTYGGNAKTDSITVKRVWIEVRTPFGMLKVGRQPSHWGLGMYINDGNGIDDDYGDTVDRFLFGTKLFEHTIFAGLDFPNEGVTNESNFEYGGQVKDATNLDDVQQVVFGFARKHSDAEAEELIENGDFVLDYGFYNVVRWQSYSLESKDLNKGYDYPPASSFSDRQGLRSKLIERNMKLYIGDLWGKFMWNRLHIETELVFLVGSIGDASLEKPVRTDDSKDNSLDLNQVGWVFKIDYKFLDDSLFVGAELGLATGDPYNDPRDATKGFGVYPYDSPQFSDSAYLRTRNGKKITDRSVTNFRFDPDYHVDMILFREIIGTVTDAIYVKPTIMYNITPSIGAKLDGIFSWAMEADSTPSFDHKKYLKGEDPTAAANPDDPKTIPVERKTSNWLGVELNLEVFYKSFDGFGASVQYGVFFPGTAFGYFDPGTRPGVDEPKWHSASSIAQSLQARLWVEF